MSAHLATARSALKASIRHRIGGAAKPELTMLSAALFEVDNERKDRPALLGLLDTLSSQVPCECTLGDDDDCASCRARQLVSRARCDGEEVAA